VRKFLFSLRAIFINLGVLAYLIWIQPGVLASLGKTPTHPDPLLGLVLALIQVLNLFAILYKGPLVQERLQGRTSNANGQIPFAIGMIVTFFMVMCYMGFVSPLATWATLGAFGIELRGTPPLWDGLLGFAYIFCMLVLNGGLMTMAIFPSLGQIHRPPWLRLGEKYPMTVEWFADIVLAAYSVTAYTIVWEQLAGSSPLQARTPQSAVVEYLGAVLMFCMVYPAANALATAEDWLASRPLWARILSGIIFIAIMVTAIAQIPHAVL
jgi:hypothetical protein